VIFQCYEYQTVEEAGTHAVDNDGARLCCASILFFLTTQCCNFNAADIFLFEPKGTGWEGGGGGFRAWTSFTILIHCVNAFVFPAIYLFRKLSLFCFKSNAALFIAINVHGVNEDLMKYFYNIQPTRPSIGIPDYVTTAIIYSIYYIYIQTCVNIYDIKYRCVILNVMFQPFLLAVRTLPLAV
jgi:hypothetical protein